MNGKIVSAGLAFALCASPAAAARAAAQSPQMAKSHMRGAAGSTPTVTESSGEIQASRIIGASVRAPDGKEIATIGDLLVNSGRGVVQLAVLKPAGGDFPHRAAVAWSSLQFKPTPTPRFVTALNPKALAAGAAGRGKPGTYDVKKDLLGNKAVGPNGKTVGHIRNLVLRLRSGRVVALVIDTGGFGEIGAHHHALAWTQAKPHGRNPVHLALSKKAISAAPVTTSMAPRPTPNRSSVAVPAVTSKDSAGNSSGSKILGPATGR